MLALVLVLGLMPATVKATEVVLNVSSELINYIKEFSEDAVKEKIVM